MNPGPLRRGAVFAAILAWGSGVACGEESRATQVPVSALAALPVRTELPFGHDLAADAADSTARRIPLMLVFTTRECPFCARARREYLGPMHRDPVYRDKVLVREIDAGSVAPLIDFEGARTTHAALARRFGVKRVPTVVVVDRVGRPLSDPVVGLMISDFYGAYLDNAIESGIAALRAPRGSP